MQESVSFSYRYLSHLFCITQIVNSDIPQLNHQIFDDNSQTRQWWWFDWFRFGSLFVVDAQFCIIELCGMTNLDTLPYYLAPSDGWDRQDR